MIEIPWNPSRRQLRVFAAIAAFFFGGLGAWLARDVGIRPASVILCGLAAYAALGLVRPESLRILYVLLTLLTLPIGRLLSRVSLVLLYFGLVTPTGWLQRLTGRQTLDLHIDREARSYWEPKPTQDRVESYFRQS